MAKIRVDLWGRTEAEANFNVEPVVDFETDAPASGDGVIYSRFFNRAVTCVHRTTVIKDGDRKNIKTEVAFGAWADRENLVYDEAANYPKEVTIED